MRKKSLRFINNKFTLNLKILALLLMITKDYASGEIWQKVCIWLHNLDLNTSVSVAQW